jgi:4-amino-4-deoxy-L-arabinose transferase-like glycosyltransferase
LKYRLNYAPQKYEDFISSLSGKSMLMEQRVPSSSLFSTRTLAVLAVVIVLSSLCLRLGYLPLQEPDEGRNAEVAREMATSGAWLVPTYDGVPYLDKPAFYFKVVALSLAAFGNNETAARLPSAVFGMALVFMVFGFGRKVHGVRCGLLAAIVVATMPLYLVLGRTVIFDMMLTFFVCGSIFAGYFAEETEGRARRKWYLLGSAAAGFATLIKGPVGFIVPTLVLLVFHRVEGRRGVWKRFFAPLNLAVFFAVTLPWFVGLCLTHRDFLYYGLVEESFHRFTTAQSFHRSQPVYFYPLVVLTTFFPWSLLLPEASIAAWKQRWMKHRADRLCLVWSVVVVVFFSISASKLAGYILSVTVACGLLVARLLEAAFANPAGRAARLLGRTFLASGLAGVMAAAVVTAGASRASALAKPLRIPLAVAEELGHHAVPLAILLAVLGLGALAARWRRDAWLGFLCLAMFTPLFVNLNLHLFEVGLSAKSGRTLAERMPALPADTELASLDCFPNGLAFYLGRTLTLISADGGELTSNYVLFSLKKSSHWPKNIVPQTKFDDWLASRQTPVFLIMKQEHRAKLEALAASRGGKVRELTPAYVGALLPVRGGP